MNLTSIYFFSTYTANVINQAFMKCLKNVPKGQFSSKTNMMGARLILYTALNLFSMNKISKNYKL